MRITLLANSRKPGGRCLAGLDAEGNWVRPVSSMTGGAISASFACPDGVPLKPLDVIEFDDVRAAALPHQVENVLVDQATIRRVDTSSMAHVEALGGAFNSPWFVESWERKIPKSEYSQSRGADSLAIMSVPDLRVIRRVDQYGEHWRGVFTSDDGDFIVDLPLTDDQYCTEKGERNRGLAATICISVGDLFNDFHYKLIAGVIEAA